MKYALFALLFLLSTIEAFASTSGFTDGSVFVSPTPIQVGGSVLIHAALNNGEKETLTGTLTFKDNDVAVGSVSVSLATGEAKIYSISWTPKQSGSHAISAVIESTTVTASQNTKQTSVDVAPEPVVVKKVATASNASSPTFTDSEAIQEKIESVSPAVSKTTAPVFSRVDSWRKSGSDFLAKKTTAQAGIVKGVHTQIEGLNKKNTPEAKSESRKLTAYQIFYTFILYILNALLIIVSKAGYFYPILFLLFFFALYKLYKRMRRPSYDY